MEKKNKEKKLLLNKRSIMNLTIYRDNILGYEGQKGIKAGSVNTSHTGTTDHPKYC